MASLPSPISEAAVKEFEADMRAAVAKLAANLSPPLTDKERDALKTRTLGPETLPFCEDAGRLMASFPQLMPRSITDQIITEFPMRLQQFSGLTTIIDLIRSLTQPFVDSRLLVGNHIRTTSDDAFSAGQRDNGENAAADALLQRMAQQRAHRKSNDDDDTPPAPQP